MKKMLLLAIVAVTVPLVGVAQEIEDDDDDMPQPYTGPQPGTPEFKEMFGDMAPPEPYTGPQPGDPDFDPSLFPEMPVILAEQSGAGKKIEEPAEEITPEKLKKMSDDEKKQLKKDLDMIRQMKMALVKKLMEFRKKYGYVPYNLKEILGRGKAPMAPAPKKPAKELHTGEADGLVPVLGEEEANQENLPTFQPSALPEPEEQDVPENELPLIRVKTEEGKTEGK